MEHDAHTNGEQAKESCCPSGNCMNFMKGDAMQECMKKCRLCPLMPVTIGVVLFLLGYYLEPAVVRVLWLIFSGFIVLMGLFGFIMMSSMKKK